MPLTLAEAKAYLHPYLSPNGAAAPEVLSGILDVSERFINSGLWRGSKAEVNFVAPSGFITLPRQFESVLGVRFDRYPVLTYSQWHTFMPGGPGELNEDCFSLNGLVDQGVGFPCFADLTGNATLRVKIESASDAAKVITIKGLDEDGVSVYRTAGEGIQVTTVNPSVTTTQVFSQVTSFIKPVTVGYVELYQVIDGVETLIGRYEPGETVADLHRYQIGRSDPPDTITALCKRKFVPVVADTDLVYPGNRGALKLGCMALNFESESDMDRAAQFWKSAYEQLNSESRQTRGGNQMRLGISQHGLKLGSIHRMV